MTTLDSQAEKSLCHIDKPANTEIPSERGFPPGMGPLESQVAGHPFDDEKFTIGMLRGPDGRVLKPVTKPLLGKREISFYENLQTSRDPLMMQLKNYVPQYYGTTELQVFGKRLTFLTLKDITEGMAEPCVMDVKIGRRTWDPLATPQKRATEELKYAESKRTYGFCITGFQVYCLPSGQLKKFGKHYGKTLDAKGVVEALKTFLNITPERPASRELMERLHSFLRKILVFFRSQQTFRFYSSSLLIAYDASKLRHCSHNENSMEEVSMNNHGPASSNVFNPNSSSKNPSCSLKRSASLSSEHELNEKFTQKDSSKMDDRRPTMELCRARSCATDFDEEIKKNPKVSMEEDSLEEEHWVKINMIDFTHVFPAEDQSKLDLNYLEGIENLIKLIERFLAQSV